MFWHATAGLTVTFLGHAGDGNIHTTVIYRRDPSSAVGGHTNALIMVLTWGNACRAGRGRVSTPWPVLLGAVLG